MTGKTKYKVGLSDCAHVSFDIFEFNLHLTFSFLVFFVNCISLFKRYDQLNDLLYSNFSIFSTSGINTLAYSWNLPMLHKILRGGGGGLRRRERGLREI